MEQPSPQPMDQDADIARFSDEDDAQLFESCGGDPDLAGEILHIKHNEPTVNILRPGFGANLNDAAWRRLGEIIGQNTHLERLFLEDCRVDVEAMCAGLQRNRSIRHIWLKGINLHNAEKMSCLAPFLTHNIRLKNISLQKCRIGQASIDILANALSNGTGNNLEELNLINNPIGDNVGGLIQAFRESRHLRILRLSFCGIGPRACASLGTLLENSDSNLTELDLGCNSIDSESTVTLAGSLVCNKKLQVLDLAHNDGIQAEGWSAMLQLVCNSSSIKCVLNSNHALRSLGYTILRGEIIGPWGVNLRDDGSDLLRASLRLNEGDDKLLVARHKIIWSHARGGLNIGEVPVAAGAMPHILAWFGNDSDQSDAEIVQYHDPPLQEPEVDESGTESIESDIESIESDTESIESDTESIQGPDIGIVSLGGVFRILHSVPGLCNRGWDENAELDTGIAQEPQMQGGAKRKRDDA